MNRDYRVLGDEDRIEANRLGLARDVRRVGGALGHECLQAYFHMRLLVA